VLNRQISAQAQKITSQPNSDGLINCLPQPGQLRGQSPQSMREKFKSSIKICAPRQFCLPGQSLLGCGPTRRYLVFCSSPRLFHRDTKLHCRLSGLATISQFHCDPWLRVRLPGLAKNNAPRRRRQLIKPPGRYS
jgi:hypothetical protein